MKFVISNPDRNLGIPKNKLMIKVKESKGGYKYLFIEPINYDGLTSEEGMMNQLIDYSRYGVLYGRFNIKVREPTKEELKRAKIIWKDIKTKIVAWSL